MTPAGLEPAIPARASRGPPPYPCEDLRRLVDLCSAAHPTFLQHAPGVRSHGCVVCLSMGRFPGCRPHVQGLQPRCVLRVSARG